jgi:hypothetical protein
MPQELGPESHDDAGGRPLRSPRSYISTGSRI